MLNSSSRRFQDGSKRRPRRLQDASRGAQDASKTAQDDPRGAQDTSKTPLRRPKTKFMLASLVEVDFDAFLKGLGGQFRAKLGLSWLQNGANFEKNTFFYGFGASFHVGKSFYMQDFCFWAYGSLKKRIFYQLCFCI